MYMGFHIQMHTENVSSMDRSYTQGFSRQFSQNRERGINFVAGLSNLTKLSTFCHQYLYGIIGEICLYQNMSASSIVEPSSKRYK